MKLQSQEQSLETILKEDCKLSLFIHFLDKLGKKFQKNIQFVLKVLLKLQKKTRLMFIKKFKMLSNKNLKK
jgi:hypothetical protein